MPADHVSPNGRFLAGTYGTNRRCGSLKSTRSNLHLPSHTPSVHLKTLKDCSPTPSGASSNMRAPNLPNGATMHVYDRPKERTGIWTFCETCKKSLKTCDWPRHEPGKKHAAALAKIREAEQEALNAEHVATSWSDEANAAAAGSSFAASGDVKPTSGRACHNCGQEGHFAKDCTEPRSGGGGGGRACHNCGSTDHLARECTEPRSGGGGGPVTTAARPITWRGNALSVPLPSATSASSPATLQRTAATSSAPTATPRTISGGNACCPGTGRRSSSPSGARAASSTATTPKRAPTPLLSHPDSELTVALVDSTMVLLASTTLRSPTMLLLVLATGAVVMLPTTMLLLLVVGAALL
ncbi:hypothetical protein IWX49DRAFT_7844 [Phyllosticta citricarpa]